MGKIKRPKKVSKNGRNTVKKRNLYFSLLVGKQTSDDQRNT